VNGGPLYLLDTNILVHFVRRDAAWQTIRDAEQPLLVEPKPLISIVTVGELKSLALCLGWGEEKRDASRYTSSIDKSRA